MCQLDMISTFHSSVSSITGSCLYLIRALVCVFLHPLTHHSDMCSEDCTRTEKKSYFSTFYSRSVVLFLLCLLIVSTAKSETDNLTFVAIYEYTFCVCVCYVV